MRQLCVKCHFTGYEPTPNFKFTGRWIGKGSGSSCYTRLDIEVLITKKIFGVIPWRKTEWVSDDDFIDVEVCRK